MSDLRPPRAAYPADSHHGLRIIALAAVALGVVLLAAAAFVLSYAGIHAIALQTGVSASLARIYPLIFDALLVVAGAAVLSLRGAGLITRCYAWLTVFVLLVAAAGADALHATGTRIPHRAGAAAVAVIPWALVLIGFGLLLAMLRHRRLRRAAAAAEHASGPAARRADPAAHGAAIAGQPTGAVSLLPARAPGQASFPALPAPAQSQVAAQPAAPAQSQVAAQPAAPAQSQVATQPAAPAQPAAAQPQVPAQPSAPASRDGVAAGQPYRQDSDADLAVDAEADQDDPTSDEASDAGHPAAALVPRSRAGEHADLIGSYGGEYGSGALNAAPTPLDPEPGHAPLGPEPDRIRLEPEPDDDGDPASPAIPRFDRMRSSPTPPTS